MNHEDKEDKIIGQLEYKKDSAKRNNTRLSFEGLRLGRWFSLKRFTYETCSLHRQGCWISIGLMLAGFFAVVVILLNVLL